MTAYMPKKTFIVCFRKKRCSEAMASLKVCLRGQVYVGAGTSKSHLAWSTDDRKISKESLSQKKTNKQTMTVLSPAKLLEDLAHCDARTAF